MTEIVLASRNSRKAAELNAILSSLSDGELKVLSLDDIGYAPEIVEDGDSFEANALIKASVPASLGYIGIADDSGLSVDALDGAPGVYSARYSGFGADDESNNEKLIEAISNVPKGARGAEYVCCMACVFPDGFEVGALPEELLPDHELVKYTRGRTAFLSRGICRGMIITKRRGKGGFGYDPLFFLPKAGKTMAELSAESKSAISHRGNALRIFVPALLGALGGKTEGEALS